MIIDEEKLKGQLNTILDLIDLRYQDYEPDELLTAVANHVDGVIDMIDHPMPSGMNLEDVMSFLRVRQTRITAMTREREVAAAQLRAIVRVLEPKPEDEADHPAKETSHV